MMDGETSVDERGFRIGERLARARRDRGMSMEDVAQALRLSPRHVSALEDERFDDLHGPTYVRGYLRNYARLVGLPVDEVLAAYGHEAKSEPVTPTVRTPAQRQVKSTDRPIRLITYLIVVVLVVLVAVWWQGQSSKTGPVNAGVGREGAETTDTSERAHPTEQIIVRAEQREHDSAALPRDVDAAPGADDLVTDAPPDAGAGVDDSPVGNAQAPAEAGRLTADEAAAENAPVSDEAPAVRPSPAVEAVPEAGAVGAGLSQLTLRYREACWTDIRDARGERLVYRTVPAGESIVVEGSAPFRIFFGNAQGVSLQVNGRPHDFSSSVRGVFARFTVESAQ
jgi:cytoskeleton protein RodZ